MIKWFFSLFGLRKEIPKTRSVEDGQPLTPWEVEFLIKHEGQKCPDCEKGQLWIIADQEANGTFTVRCGCCQATLIMTDVPLPIYGHRVSPGVMMINPTTYRG
ncbi:MAG TPA: hypothetical protein VMU11_00265 [Verrucomicrobiae bacterium]|nr:hypothetical protein [Verrucomicrobiae bacterium]